MIVESNFNGMAHFLLLIETLKGSIKFIKKSFPDFTFIVLQTEGIRLKVEEDSSIENLREQITERNTFLVEGNHKALIRIYRDEGILY